MGVPPFIIYVHEIFHIIHHPAMGVDHFSVETHGDLGTLPVPSYLVPLAIDCTGAGATCGGTGAAGAGAGVGAGAA